MATAERHADVDWQGDLRSGSGSFDVGSGALTQQQVTFATRTEDPAGHTSPEELIAAAHATCYAMALSNTLAEGGNPPEALHVTSKVVLDLGSLKISTDELTVEGTVPGMDQAAFEEAARQAEGTCPVSNALRGNVDIQLTATLT